MNIFRHVSTYVTCALINLSFSASSGQTIHPEFSGEWFDQVISTQESPTKYDSCNIGHYKYKNKSNDKQILINELFKDLPLHTDCQWTKPSFFAYGGSIPADFPATPNEFMVMMQDPAAIKSEVWDSRCMRETYQVDYVSRAIYPSYRCLSGSRPSPQKPVSCLSKPLVCAADVVGRDLNEGPITKWMGHVGLTFVHYDNDGNPINVVLEALNNDKVINTNTLRSFENASPFWGEVYGLVDIDNLSGFVDLDKAGLALNAGLNQRNFDPEYTTTIFWREGSYSARSVYDSVRQEFIKERAMVRAKFRCDTFVNYCYMKGFGVQLPTQPALGVLPRSTYNSFIHKRVDVPSEQNVDQYPQAAAQEVSDYFISEVHDAFGNKHLSRAEKIEYCLQKANSSDIEEFSYHMDTLASLATHHIIPELVNRFGNESIAQKRKKLITAIVGSTLNHEPDSAVASIDSSTINNIVVAQDLMKDVLKNELNLSVLKHSICHALSVLPMTRQNYAFILQAVERLHAQSEEEYHFSNEQKFFILLSIAFANDDMQTWLLPQLLEAELPSIEKDIFNQKLFFMLKLLSPADINQEAKRMLMAYLNQADDVSFNNYFSRADGKQ